jgi:hypothetical protein
MSDGTNPETRIIPDDGTTPGPGPTDVTQTETTTGYGEDAPPTESAPAAPSAPDTNSAIEEAIGKWINGHLYNSPLAQATEAWNHVMGSLNALRTYLKEELGKVQ